MWDSEEAKVLYLFCVEAKRSYNQHQWISIVALKRSNLSQPTGKLKTQML